MQEIVGKEFDFLGTKCICTIYRPRTRFVAPKPSIDKTKKLWNLWGLLTPPESDFLIITDRIIEEELTIEYLDHGEFCTKTFVGGSAMFIARQFCRKINKESS